MPVNMNFGAPPVNNFVMANQRNANQGNANAQSSGFQPSWAGGMIGSGIMSMLGNRNNNPAEAYAEGMQPGIDRVNQGVDKATGYLNPWREAGMSGLNSYMDLLKKYQNPQQMYNDTMSGWKMSQGAQGQMNGAMDAIKNRMATMGLGGSGQEFKDLGKTFEDYAAKDQNQYFNNVMGIGNTGLQGYGNLSQQGAGAAGTMGGYEMQGAGDIASMYNAMAAAQAAQAANENKQGADAGGGIGGLLGGVMKWL